jgi:plasmid stability protein
VNDATLLIKKMPADLKLWLAREAARNDRSMNKETIRLLEEARALRENAPKPERDNKAIEQILEDLRALPIVDRRPMDEVMYDESGMPK